MRGGIGSRAGDQERTKTRGPANTEREKKFQSSHSRRRRPSQIFPSNRQPSTVPISRNVSNSRIFFRIDMIDAVLGKRSGEIAISSRDRRTPSRREPSLSEHMHCTAPHQTVRVPGRVISEEDRLNPRSSCGLRDRSCSCFLARLEPHLPPCLSPPSTLSPTTPDDVPFDPDGRPDARDLTTQPRPAPSVGCDSVSLRENFSQHELVPALGANHLVTLLVTGSGCLCTFLRDS